MINHDDIERLTLDGYRLIDENALISLVPSRRNHAALLRHRKHSTCVRRGTPRLVGELWREHSDILSDYAVLVMDCLIAAADDLTAVSGH